MLARVVEHQRHAFLPEEVVATDLDPALLRLGRHDQRIVEADHAGRRAAMGLDLGAAVQDAEQRGVDARDAVDRGVGVGHGRDVVGDLVAPDLEQEGAPGAARHVEIARMDLVQRRDVLVMGQQVLEVGLDLVVALLQFGQDRELSQRVVAAQRQLGHAAQDHVRHLEIEVLDRLLRQPDILGQVEATLLTDIVRFHNLQAPGDVNSDMISRSCRAFSRQFYPGKRGRPSQYPPFKPWGTCNIL